MSRKDAIWSHVLYAQLSHCEACFIYTGGLGSCAEHVGDIGDVVGGGYSFRFLEETEGGLALFRRRNVGAEEAY